MTVSQPSYARIVSTGSYLPERVMTNDDLAKLVDTSDEWIRARTGIGQRHLAADGELTSDLCTQAAQRALADAGFEAADLDLIVVGTTTPDVVFPATAVHVQHNLGAHGCMAFDVNAACAGFIYALNIANDMIRAGSVRRALVLGAETLSRMLNWDDRTTCVLFGDGAGAVLLEASDQPGIRRVLAHADGAHIKQLHCEAGVSRGFNDGFNHGVFVQMTGNEVFKHAVKQLGRVVDETLEREGMGHEDVDWLIPHQANLRIIQAIAKRLKLPMERVITTIEQHGNTSAASVPLALDAAIRSGKVQRGQRLMLEAFGGGFTWGAALIDY